MKIANCSEERAVFAEKRIEMIDMHAHLACLEGGEGSCSTGKAGEYASAFLNEKQREAQGELDLRESLGITTCFSSGTPFQWQVLESCQEHGSVLHSFGIHPWYAHQYDPGLYMEYFRQCDVVGEIGMDSVWCAVPLEIQRKSLECQLQIAADLHRPVILHTKGQEAVIARLLTDFPEKICVHWYSGNERDLDAYLEKDCYFTLGPDTSALCGLRGEGSTGKNGNGEQKEAVTVRQRMLREIPSERLFVETDGIGAVAWAKGLEWLELPGIEPALWDGIVCAAAWKGISAQKMSRKMEQNLMRFCGKRVFR